MLRYISLFTLVFVAPLIADDKKVAKEFEPFQGNWKMTKGTLNGKEMTAEELKKMDFMLEIKGDEGTPTEGGKKQKTGKMKLDTGKSPMEIDVVVPESPMTMIGIYKFDKGTLQMAFSFDGKTRPKGFDAAMGNMTMVLEKVK